MHKFIYLKIILLLLFISFSSPTLARESGRKTTVQATIPAKIDIRLFGYTAPNAIVQAEGVRIFGQVSSDSDGYFLIDPLPISPEAEEVCVTTIDAEGRAGFPLCINLPEADKPAEIGPILLSPTLSLSAGSIWQSEKAAATGQTIPNSKVDFSFFEIETVMRAQNVLDLLAQKIIQPVEAIGLPLLTTKSDIKGNYSISLPTWKSSAFRIFTKAYWHDAPTHKSLTLSFNVGEFMEYWVRSVLPKILLYLFIMILLITLIYMEYKTKKVRVLFVHFSETKLKPFGVRTHLRLRRLWYNLREYLRSNQK